LNYYEVGKKHQFTDSASRKHNMRKSTLASTLAMGLALGLLGTKAHAQDVSSALSGWKGSANLGASSASGNSENTTITGGIRLAKTLGRWEHLVFGTLNFSDSTTVVPVFNPGTGIQELDPATGEAVATTDSTTTSERIHLGYQPKYFVIPERTYVFGILDYEQDEPANIDSNTRQIIGVGHTFFDTSKASFIGEAGIGNTLLEPVVGDDLDGAILYLGLHYLNDFTDTLRFNADLRVDAGSENSYTELGLGLAFKVSTRLSLKLGYFLRGNTDLDNPTNPLSSDTDSLTTFNLVFDI